MVNHGWPTTAVVPPLLSPWMKAASLCLAKDSERGPSPLPGWRVALRVSSSSTPGCCRQRSPGRLAILSQYSFPFLSTNQAVRQRLTSYSQCEGINFKHQGPV